MDSKLFADMFHLGVPVLEKIIRPVIVYAFLIIALRLAGKRELAQLNPFDLVVLLTLSNTVQNAIIGEDNSVLGGIIGATTLLGLNYIVVRYLSKHARVEKIFGGETVVLLEDGKPMLDRLDKESLSCDEFEAAARRAGFGSLEDIQQAVLEANGSISFIAKKPEKVVPLHEDLVRRLDQISRELSELKGKLSTDCAD